MERNNQKRKAEEPAAQPGNKKARPEKADSYETRMANLHERLGQAEKEIKRGEKRWLKTIQELYKRGWTKATLEQHFRTYHPEVDADNLPEPPEAVSKRPDPKGPAVSEDTDMVGTGVENGVSVSAPGVGGGQIQLESALIPDQQQQSQQPQKENQPAAPNAEALAEQIKAVELHKEKRPMGCAKFWLPSGCVPGPFCDDGSHLHIGTLARVSAFKSMLRGQMPDRTWAQIQEEGLQDQFSDA